MGYVIIYVQAATGARGPRLAELSKRAKLGDRSIVGPGWMNTVALLAEAGFEVHAEFGSRDLRAWPLEAVAYTSKRKDGVGRSGSSIFGLPCRRRDT